MRVLVTGGAGFIGSNLIRLLLTERTNVEVINLDNLTYAGNLGRLSPFRDDPRYRFVRGDIADANIVGNIFPAGIDCVVNLAAETHVDLSIIDPAPFLHTNVVGTQCLLEAALHHRIQRFVQVSSDEVYGDVPASELRDEASMLSPSNPYAASKAAADHLVGAYQRTYNVPGIVLRSSNNYGPWQFPEKLIALLIANAIEDKPLPLYGDGRQERDWMHVDDFCRAISIALEMPGATGVYNVSAYEPSTNIAVARQIVRHLGKPESLITLVQDRPGHDRRYAVDSSRFRKDTHWAPEIRFDAGLQRTISWYQQNSDWLQAAQSPEYRAYYQRNYVHRTQTLSERSNRT